MNANHADEDPNSPSHHSELKLLHVDSIRLYDHNPRQSPHPEYPRLYDSVKQRGIDQPLTVAKEPAGNGYIVQAGGNTRLAILKSLYESTTDPRYAHTPCVVREAEDDASTIIAHLCENDVRAGLTFIDRARALIKVRNFVAQERPDGSISQREFARYLRERGYAVSQPTVSHMAYAVERLLPLLPIALEAGMSKRQVIDVQLLERDSSRVWAKYGRDEEPFHELFASLCQRYDRAEWDIDPLRNAIESEIAFESEIGLHTARMLVDRPRTGAGLELSTLEPIVEDSSRCTGRPTDEATKHAPPTVDGNTEVLDNGGCSERVETASPALNVSTLRRQLWWDALDLASRHSMEEVIGCTFDSGFGFLVHDYPTKDDSTKSDHLDEAGRNHLWREFAICCGLFSDPKERTLRLLPRDSTLALVLRSADDNEIVFNRVPANSGRVSEELWSKLPDADWQRLSRMRDTHRQINQLIQHEEQMNGGNNEHERG